ncbi:hypothetical protein TNIN_357081 [Trichonephila inaurata madagascariensis]|uniref:Uncharacterized protein n=1 Tax=Trichonephila inaurata madagascariensis TaxID=2747483 RepID=A0A8X6X9M6_9ARAC|nr:hypothetical protein TNIN_357081 [Trichonephila inaurata madagascariensis]
MCYESHSSYPHPLFPDLSKVTQLLTSFLLSKEGAFPVPSGYSLTLQTRAKRLVSEAAALSFGESHGMRPTLCDDHFLTSLTTILALLFPLLNAM